MGGEMRRKIIRPKSRGTPSRAAAFKAFGLLLVLVWTVSVGALVTPVPALAAPKSEIVSAADTKVAKAVFKAIDRNRFKDALRLTRQVKSPDVVRVLMWSYLTASRSPAKFNDVKAFLDHRADWPKRRTLLKRAEETLPNDMPANEVLAWFETMGGPVSTAGRVREAEALLALGKTQAAKAKLRKVWVEDNFTKSLEKRFYRRHSKHIAKADNVARMERLIWEERYWPARRQRWRVDETTRKLAVARWGLMKREGNVDKAIADLQKHAPQLINDPGLVYERLRWRRRKGRINDAAALFDSVQGDPVRPDKWWVERRVIARDFLSTAIKKVRKKDAVQKAYAIATNHGLSME